MPTDTRTSMIACRVKTQEQDGLQQQQEHARGSVQARHEAMAKRKRRAKGEAVLGRARVRVGVVTESGREEGGERRSGREADVERVRTEERCVRSTEGPAGKSKQTRTKHTYVMLCMLC